MRPFSFAKDRGGELKGRFCSLRCQSFFDAGYTPPADSPDTLSGWKIVAGAEIGADYYATLFGRTPIAIKRTSDGFKIACAGYQKEFDSTGLRCCSDKCERRYREREANIALMAEVGVKPSTKRKCAAPGCATIIPNWRKGRKVSAATRFCSPTCQKRARRATEQTPEPVE
jgi:ribosomal protein L24E